MTEQGTPATPSPVQQPGMIAVPLGKAVFAQALRYTAMFGPKPFPEALLIYFDNGSYKILSLGEEHYGSYVSAGEPAAPPRHVAFLSWPSTDWERNVASHTLTFEAQTEAFIQSLVLPGDPTPHAQHGYFASIAQPERIDLSASWEQLRETYDDVFERLREYVASR